MTDVDGLILAAGRSSRMISGNKLQAVLAGKTLLQHVIDRLSPQVDCVFINGGSGLCADLPYPIIEDQLDDFQGPLTGLYSALINDQLSDASYLMMVPCDGPFIPRNLVSELYQQIIKNDADLACARYQGFAQSTFTLWNKRTVKAVKQAFLVDKNGGFKPLLKTLNSVYLDWPEQKINPFFNINSCEDLAEAEAIICQ